MPTSSRVLLAFLLAQATLPAAAQVPCAGGAGPDEPIAAAKLIIENNAGDGDIGVQGFFDHPGWRELCLFAPDGTLLFRAVPEGAVGELGMSEIFWESVEPEYGDWDYDDLKAAFPEGLYRVAGISAEGRPLTGAARFTTVLPAMPVILAPKTAPEEDDPELPVLPLADLAVEWEPVKASADGRPLTLTGYQMTVVRDDMSDPDGFARHDFSVRLGPEATGHRVPASFFVAGAVYELEVLAIEDSGNQTIGGASFFRIAPN
jgi:hypothetical protein